MCTTPERQTAITVQIILALCVELTAYGYAPPQLCLFDIKHLAAVKKPVDFSLFDLT